MRCMILGLALLSLTACAHDSKPKICARDFDFKDMAYDLDGSGTVTVADFNRYLALCDKG